MFRERGPEAPPSLLYNGYGVAFPSIKRPGRGVDHPSPPSAEVKERIQLSFYSLLWAFMASSRATFIFLYREKERERERERERSR